MAIFLFSTTLSANNTFQQENVIEFNNSSFESHLLNNEKIVLKSKDGELNLDTNEIILKGEVEGRLNVDGESFNITTGSLRGNLLGKSILSKERVVFESKGLEIISSSMEITQKAQEGIKVLFWKANLNVLSALLSICSIDPERPQINDVSPAIFPTTTEFVSTLLLVTVKAAD